MGCGRTLTTAVLALVASAAGVAGADRPESAVRRLSRVEYENTLRDLLDVTIDVQDALPPDVATDGFDHVGRGQQVSSFLLERYLETADKALALAVADTDQPPRIKQTLRLVDERQVKHATERVYRRADSSLILFSSSAWNSVTLGQFYPPHRGLYRFRITARSVQSDGRPIAFRVEAGPMLMGTKNRLVGHFDAPADSTKTFEFTEHLEARSTIRLSPHGLANAQTVHAVGADAYAGPGLQIDGIEVEGPLFDAWPPPSQRRLFGDLPREPVRRPGEGLRYEVVSADPLGDARRLLEPFARRAYRRPPTPAEVDELTELVRRRMEQGAGFDAAMRTAFRRALVSPQFLFLRASAGPLDDFALASRLSYFLWSAPPDDELMKAAESGKLRDPAALKTQVERLLDSPRARAFTVNFLGQWLDLRKIDFTEPDRRLYPEYDDLLRSAMLQEPERFFEELLRDDLSILNFVASDFTMLNDRLARHYGVPGVEGRELRKVRLPHDAHRGGLLTMAAVLKTTADGTTTSPVVRGAWVLDRILGAPPDPPPAGVPAVEPDVRGATTMREQLARHRSDSACAACHVDIDPLGFALESFDVIGGWRDHYRSVGRGEPVTIDGRRTSYLRGPKVDPSDTLADGRKFADVDELKRLLLADRDAIARAFVRRLTVYATGRTLDPADAPAVDAIVDRIRGADDGLRTLVHTIVQSPLFLEK